MVRSLFLLVMTVALGASEVPPDPDRSWSETLPDGRVRTWVPAGWAVQRRTASEQYESWVAGHWEETPLPASAPSPARGNSQTVVSSGRVNDPVTWFRHGYYWPHEATTVLIVASWPLWLGCQHSGLRWHR